MAKIECLLLAMLALPLAEADQSAAQLPQQPIARPVPVPQDRIPAQGLAMTAASNGTDYGCVAFTTQVTPGSSPGSRLIRFTFANQCSDGLPRTIRLGTQIRARQNPYTHTQGSYAPGLSDGFNLDARRVYGGPGTSRTYIVMEQNAAGRFWVMEAMVGTRVWPSFAGCVQPRRRGTPQCPPLMGTFGNAG